MLLLAGGDLPPTAKPDKQNQVVEFSVIDRDSGSGLKTPGAAFLRLRPKQLYAVNGRAWPHTERITHDLGEEVRWRGVNLSTQGHPMHLHGFYFDVEREGNETHDGTIAPRRRIREVTHLLAPGSTMSMIWTPERAGRGFSTVTLCCTCHRH